MAEPTDDPGNLYLVRRYSEVIRMEMADEPLSQGLAAKVDSDRERENRGKFYLEEAMKGMFGEDGTDPKMYESICQSKLQELETKSTELQETWDTFKDKMKIANDSDGPVSVQPDISVLRRAIQKAQGQIQSNQDTKFGKVKSFFNKSAQVLDNHNYLFDLLPSGDKYTSVFTGAFSTIVKATVTHDKIAGEISSGFDEIADQVRSFYFVIKLHPRSTYIKYYIAMFYFELFGFLVSIMREWYQSSWRRLSKSLGSSFLESTVQGTLSTLSLYTKRVEAEDARRTREMTTRQLYALGAMVQAGLASQAKAQKDMRRDYAMLSTFVKQDLPTKIVQDVLNDGFFQANQPTEPLPLSGNTARSIEGGTSPEPDQRAAPSWSRDSIQTDVAHLRLYVQAAAHVERLIDLSHSITVNMDMSSRVHQWVMNTSSEALWIEGQSGTAQPSQSTLTSAFMLGNLRRVGIPAMVEYCQYDPRYWRTWNPEKELLNVIYALVYQAATMLPETIEPELVPLDFSPSRFQALDGNVDTLPAAVKLLADLIAVGPPLQFLLVDGLQLFDGRQLTQLVQNTVVDFVAVLCKAVADASGNRVFKVLFTTDGMVTELADASKAKLLSRQRCESENEDELLTIKDIDLIK